MADEYHPLAVRLWSTMTIHSDGRHELPLPLERAALAFIRRIAEAREIALVHASLYSLWAETRRLGQRECSEAYGRLVEEARKLSIESADEWRRSALPPRAPDSSKAVPALPEKAVGTPLASTLVLQPRRA